MAAPSALTRRQVCTTIATALTGIGLTRSRFAPDWFGYDADKLVHKCFAVGDRVCRPNRLDDRQRHYENGQAQTDIVVKTAYRIRPDNMLEDYSDAQDHEELVARAVVAVNLKIQQGAMTYTLPESGDWRIATLLFTAFHRWEME